MHQYFIKTPWIVKKLFSSYTWSKPAKDKVVYLTFDDGPHPQITPFVLEELKKYEALATFFCIGKNVQQYPHVYQRVQDEGHSVGNHTQDHLNGWKVPDDVYLKNVAKATDVIQSNLFRPPYGRIKRTQAKRLPEAMRQEGVQVIMWDVLSADFDTKISADECLDNVLRNYRKGSVIVFHDSEKAFPRLKVVLPQVLKRLNSEGWRFEKL